MGNFDRTPKATANAILPLPERLVRLNFDLESQAKRIDYVYAVRNNAVENYRIKVAVTEMGKVAQAESGFRFMAVAFLNRERHQAYGHRPSDAFLKVIEQIKWTTSRMTWERNTVVPTVRRKEVANV